MKKPQTTLAVQAAAMVLCLLLASNADAEIRTITATGEYRMGDNDTRTDAKRLALLDAKRLALEQAGTYIESITEVKNFDLTKEEIRAYTAGIVEVTELDTKDVLDGTTHIIRVAVTAKIDTDVVARQIDALTKNEDVKSKLLQAENEISKHRKELEAKTHELAAAKSKAQIKDVAQRRGQIIARIEAEQLVMRAGTALIEAPRDIFGRPPANTRKYARSLLEQALLLDPDYAYAHLWMGPLLQDEGDLDGAIAELRKGLHLDPKNSTGHVYLGDMLYAKGDLDGAIGEWWIAIRIMTDYDDARAHYVFGKALLSKGLRKRAAQEFREALRLAPDTPDGRELAQRARAGLRDLAE